MHILPEHSERLLGGCEVAGLERIAQRLKTFTDRRREIERTLHSGNRRNVLKILLYGGKCGVRAGQVAGFERCLERHEILGLELDISLDLGEQGLQAGGSVGRRAGGTRAVGRLNFI